jgi:hypothetical protein
MLQASSSTFKTSSATNPSVHQHTSSLELYILLTQGALFQIHQVLLDMLRAGGAYDDGIPVFLFHQTMVSHPAEGNLRER